MKTTAQVLKEIKFVPMTNESCEMMFISSLPRIKNVTLAITPEMCMNKEHEEFYKNAVSNPELPVLNVESDIFELVPVKEYLLWLYPDKEAVEEFCKSL